MPNFAPMELHERLRELRRSRGLTQTQVAEKMDMAQSNFAVWESGKTDIPIGKLKQLAEVLGVSLAHLLGMEITSASEDSAEVMRLQRDVEQLKRVIDDKDDLINRLRNEEQRFSTAVDKLLSALHTAYQNWYLDLPAGKPTLEKVGKQNLIFWTQFFSIEAVRFVHEIRLVQTPFFNELFGIYKDHVSDETLPYNSREGFANDVWIGFMESIEKADLNTANKYLEKVNRILREYKGRIVWHQDADISPFGN